MALTLLKGKCSFCNSESDLSRCGSCRVVHYCGREHQLADRESHKDACIKIKKTGRAVDKAERDLRAKPPGFTLPEDVFVNGIGRCWGILDTRDYMRARYAHLDAILLVKTFEAVQAALEECRDMHSLCK